MPGKADISALSSSLSEKEMRENLKRAWVEGNIGALEEVYVAGEGEENSRDVIYIHCSTATDGVNVEKINIFAAVFYSLLLVSVVSTLSVVYLSSEVSGDSVLNAGETSMLQNKL